MSHAPHAPRARRSLPRFALALLWRRASRRSSPPGAPAPAGTTPVPAVPASRASRRFDIGLGDGRGLADLRARGPRRPHDVARARRLRRARDGRPAACGCGSRARRRSSSPCDGSRARCRSRCCRRATRCGWATRVVRARRGRAARLERAGTGAGASRSSSTRAASSRSPRACRSSATCSAWCRARSARCATRCIEAGRAQAIAARSYTLFYRGRRGAEGFDLYAHASRTRCTARPRPSGRSPPAASRATRGLVAHVERRAHPRQLLLDLRRHHRRRLGGVADGRLRLPHSHADRGGRTATTARSRRSTAGARSGRAVQFVANLERFAPRAERGAAGGRAWASSATCAWTRARARGACGGCASRPRRARSSVPAYSHPPGAAAAAATRARSCARTCSRSACARRLRTRRAQVIGERRGLRATASGCARPARWRWRAAVRGPSEILAHYYPGATLERLY